MMKMPPEKDFGGSTDIPTKVTRDTWRQRMNNVDCVGCHQLGQEATRTIPAQLGQFNREDAWIRRVQSGQWGERMTSRLAGELGGVPYKYFGDWTERVAKGELPKTNTYYVLLLASSLLFHDMGVDESKNWSEICHQDCRSSCYFIKVEISESCGKWRYSSL